MAFYVLKAFLALVLQLHTRHHERGQWYASIPFLKKCLLSGTGLLRGRTRVRTWALQAGGLLLLHHCTQVTRVGGTCHVCRWMATLCTQLTFGEQIYPRQKRHCLASAPPRDATGTLCNWAPDNGGHGGFKSPLPPGESDIQARLRNPATHKYRFWIVCPC